MTCATNKNVLKHKNEIILLLKNRLTFQNEESF